MMFTTSVATLRLWTLSSGTAGRFHRNTHSAGFVAWKDVKEGYTESNQNCSLFWFELAGVSWSEFAAGTL